jgi:hypothetical protein
MRTAICKGMPVVGGPLGRDIVALSPRHYITEIS